MNKQQEIPEVMHVHAVARHLRCHRSTIYKLVEEGELIAIRLGRRGIRIKKASLDDYLFRQEIDPIEYLE
ncbi:MAG: helix-turn-helix domain-containing protein [Desulfurivibrio sp.]|nr:helix-turn-helix domain-containing protein [Desulfurivibrio sp.]